jgi:hypothetical protein
LAVYFRFNWSNLRTAPSNLSICLSYARAGIMDWPVN